MSVLTLDQAVQITVGGTPCLMLTYQHDTGERTAYVIPAGTLTHRATEYGTTDIDTLIDLILYESHMPEPDLTAGLDARLAQLAAVRADITITIPDPSLLDPLRSEPTTTEPEDEAA